MAINVKCKLSKALNNQSQLSFEGIRLGLACIQGVSNRPLTVSTSYSQKAPRTRTAAATATGRPSNRSLRLVTIRLPHQTRLRKREDKALSRSVVHRHQPTKNTVTAYSQRRRPIGMKSATQAATTTGFFTLTVSQIGNTNARNLSSVM